MTMLTALTGRRLRVLGAASGLGFPDPGCALAPDQVRDAGPVVSLVSGGGLIWEGSVRGDGKVNSVAALAAFDHRLAQRVRGLAGDGDLLAVIGGDHAIAAGTWAGVHAALGAAPGLIWIDAHLDSHTPATTHSGNLHGMPLACLLGHGPRRLTHLLGNLPALDPARVVVMGVRSFEAEEAALLHRLGVRVVGIDEIQRRGLAEVLAEAVALVTRDTPGFGISLDIDAIDPEAAPGVSTPVAGGLAAAALIEALHVLRLDARLKLVEIAEFNPLHDREDRTLRLLLDLLDALAPKSICELSAAT